MSDLSEPYDSKDPIDPLLIYSTPVILNSLTLKDFKALFQ